jgi:hypothetical protein
MEQEKSKNSSVKTVKLKDLLLDDKNANKGSDLGNELLATSIERYGAGRGALLDKNGKVIAGNHTIKELIKQGYNEAIIVQTEGDKLVLTQRVDVDLDSKAGRELALADNRVAQANIVFDMDLISNLNTEFDLDLSDIGFSFDTNGGPFFPDEMQEPDESEMMETEYQKSTPASEYQQIVFPLALTLTKAEKLEWDSWKKENSFKFDNDAFLYIFKKIKNGQ